MNKTNAIKLNNLQLVMDKDPDKTGEALRTEELAFDDFALKDHAVS